MFKSLRNILSKEGNVLFNDTLNTFYLWVYGISNKRYTWTCIYASAPQLVQQRLWYVLSWQWDNAYKTSLAYWKTQAVK